MVTSSGLWVPFVASLLAAVVTTIGIYVIRHFEDWGRRNSTYFACFAAGVLISVSFLHIVPKTIGMNEQAPLYLLTGYMFMHLFNRFITAYVCDKNPEFAIGLVPLLGIGFHSFLDGVVYSITFTVSTFTGILAAMGMVLHEFPEGIITYLLLLRGGGSPKQSLVFAFLAAGVSTPLGTLLSFPMISRIEPSMLGAMLSVSAGALIYVGATHLLPHAEREPAKYSLFALAGGVLVAAGIIVSEP
jgi:zinc and cadmium transporter